MNGSLIICHYLDNGSVIYSEHYIYTTHALTWLVANIVRIVDYLKFKKKTPKKYRVL